MFMNPISKKGRRDQPPGHRITFVVKDVAAAASITYNDLKLYCKIHNIVLTVREYCSKTYSEDCDNIIRLPAFHIYKNDEWLATVHNKNDIHDKVQSDINSWQREQEQLHLRREAWRQRLNSVTSFFGIKQKVKYTSR